MRIVLDANILISLFITPGKVVELFFLDKLEIHAPKLLFIEFERNLDVVQRKTKLRRGELDMMLRILKERITLVPAEEFKEQREHATSICPDPKDVPYFALALHFKCPLWSNETQLKEQNTVRVYASHELLRKYEL